MDFSFSAEQQALLDQVAQLTREKLAPRAANYDREVRHPVESWHDLWEAGLLAMTIPREHGGMAVDQLLGCAIVETIARGCAATAMTLYMHSIPLRFLGAFGTPEQQARYFPEVTKGGKLFASWASEPQISVSRAFVLETSLRRDADGYVLNGTKHFCTMAGAASYYMIWAQPDESIDPKGRIQLALIPADRPGIEIFGDWDTLGMHATVSPPVRFENCQVKPDELLGQPGAAFRPGGAELFGLGLTSVCLGVAQGALEFAAEYCRTKTFQPDNVPIAESPQTQQAFAEMAIALESARWLLYRAAVQSAIEPARGGVLTAQAKYAVTEASLLVTSRCLQVCGGRSAMRLLPLERAFRDVRTATLMPPSIDAMLLAVGRDILGQGSHLYRHA